MHFIKLAAFIGLCASFTVALLVPRAPPAGFENTPAGVLPQSQVHYVPAGAHVHLTADTILILEADGTVLEETPRSHAVTQTNHSSDGSGLPVAPGWLGYAHWLNENLSNPISNFSASWEVPPVPATDSNQTLFLFNALETVTGVSIIQPVLQYGVSAAGGGSHWAVGHWFFDSLQAYWTNVTAVSPGQNLTSIISSVNESSFTYFSQFSDVAGSYGLEVMNSDQLVWATLGLDAYDITNATDFPRGSTNFTNINIETLDSSHPSVNWREVSEEGFATTVVVDGSTNGEIRIIYPL